MANHTPDNTIGIIGLGRMGGSLAQQATEKGYSIVGYDPFPRTDLAGPQLQFAADHADLVARLPRPRRIMLYVPAGPVVDQLIDELAQLLEEGDIIVDGGNSYWGDSIRRAERLREKGLYLVDCGTSGGVRGARHGACFMVGGDDAAVQPLARFFTDLAVPDGYVHAGPPGAGHYTKLVHNGIEFGMLQAIGEGMALLEKYRTPLDISAVLKCWNNGSVIRSWLIELMREQLDAHPGFDVPSYVEDTGEVNWLVADALRMEVPVPVIAQSVMQLFASRGENPVSNRAVALMRHGFGEHPFGPAEGIREERQTGRIMEFPPLPDRDQPERAKQ